MVRRGKPECQSSSPRRLEQRGSEGGRNRPDSRGCRNQTGFFTLKLKLCPSQIKNSLFTVCVCHTADIYWAECFMGLYDFHVVWVTVFCLFVVSLCLMSSSACIFMLICSKLITDVYTCLHFLIKPFKHQSLQGPGGNMRVGDLLPSVQDKSGASCSGLLLRCDWRMCISL